MKRLKLIKVIPDVGQCDVVLPGVVLLGDGIDNMVNATFKVRWFVDGIEVD
jgi:hypothetical protein